jgi:hypothetical protein
MVRLRPKYREGRCYELAYKHLERDERFSADTWSLVHGMVISPGDLNDQPLGHAWLEQGDRLEPIREVWIHDEWFAARRLSMMRIMARRMKAATVVA